VLLIVVGLLAAASSASADRIYFGSNTTISYADLDGSGGGDLSTGAATVAEARGIAIDPAAGRIYWANIEPGNTTISYANLDGSGGGDLATTGAPLNTPTGVALDLAAGRIYWANNQGPASERIAYARLDGTGGGTLSTTGATAVNPSGVAIDPAARRIYWINLSGPVSYANLDGSGGGDISTSGASTAGRNLGGIAIDRSTRRAFWTAMPINPSFDPQVSFAALDGSGGGDLATTGATFAYPEGVAVDAAANRVYWTNTAAFGGSGSIAYAKLDGSGGGGSVSLAGATTSPGIAYPALLKAPLGTGAPKLTAQIALRPRFLTCDEGTWAGDMPEAQLYRAPHSFSYRWTKNGQPIPGATRSNIGVEGTGGGDYACQVTATNAGGSTTQTSRFQFVCCPPSPLATAARVALVKRGRALLKLTCPAGTEPCAGRIHLESLRPPRRGHASAKKGPKIPGLPVIYGEASISIPAGETRIAGMRLSRFAKSRLARSRRHRLKARLDGRAVEPRTVLLKLAKKKRKRR
jgi:hypothetical protein